MSFISFYLLSFLLIFTSVKGSEFDYGKQAKWYDDYQQCSFNRQSPIELISEEATVSYDMSGLEFLYYETVFDVPVTIQNNGHTANIVIPKPTNFIESLWQFYDKFSPQVSGGPLPEGIFVADSVHFHWGSKDTHGSEHVIDSTRFSMEMHIVHRNGKYMTVEEAREHEDGLAVLSVIYNVEDTKTAFVGLSDVISALQSITEYDEEATIEGFSLAALFGSMNKDEFFTYQGSLTTPPCSQAVTWVVFANPIAITHEQMTQFHLLVDPHGEIMENNYRSLQSKGMRQATVSYDMSGLEFLYYETVFDVPVTIQNNGHTANIVIPKPTNFIESLWQFYDKFSPQVSGGPLPEGIFVADSVHFHWGSKDTHGSEHVIDSTRFSMEMHIVHRNGKYMTVEEAREHEDGLAVLSVIYNVEDTKTAFVGLSDVISALQSITEYDEEATIEGFSLAALFGSMNKDEFFTYQGSLTTPPCSQAVTWVVFANPIAITHEQMTQFHLLVDPHGEIMENNYRSLQSKGMRQVTLRKSALKNLWETFKNIKPMPLDKSN